MPDLLDTLVHQRDQDSQQDILSFVIVQWGIVNILGMWIYHLVWNSLFFWVFWTPACILLMVAVVSWKTRGLDRSLWAYKNLPRIWVGVLSVLPLLIWVFPGPLHLYTEEWIYPLTTAWVSLGMYATGVFTKRWPVALGSLAYVGAAPFYLLYPDSAVWIFTGANALGLVIPGMVRIHGSRT